jgi:hypothetical protein
MMNEARREIIKDFDQYLEQERKERKVNYAKLVVEYIDKVLYNKVYDIVKTVDPTSANYDKAIDDLHDLYETSFLYILSRRKKRQYYAALGYVYLAKAQCVKIRHMNYYEYVRYYVLAFDALHAAVKLDRSNRFLLQGEWIAATYSAIETHDKIMRIMHVFGKQKHKKLAIIYKLCNNDVDAFLEFLHYKYQGYIYHGIEAYKEAYYSFRKALTYNSRDYMTVLYCRDAGKRHYTQNGSSRNFRYGDKLLRMIKRSVPSGAHPLERYLLLGSDEDLKLSYRRMKKKIVYSPEDRSKIDLILQEVQKIRILDEQDITEPEAATQDKKRIAILTNVNRNGGINQGPSSPKQISLKDLKGFIEKKKADKDNYLLWIIEESIEGISKEEKGFFIRGNRCLFSDIPRIFLLTLVASANTLVTYAMIWEAISPTDIGYNKLEYADSKYDRWRIQRWLQRLKHDTKTLSDIHWSNYIINERHRRLTGGHKPGFCVSGYIFKPGNEKYIYVYPSE